MTKVKFGSPQQPIAKTVSVWDAQRLYDRLAGFYDLAEPFEGQAQSRALQLLALAPGQSVVEVGPGTGRLLAQLAGAVAPGGRALGLDLSAAMLAVARRRLTAALCQADARRLPLADDCCDRLFSSYVLDLVATADLPVILAEFRRVLRPGGRLVLVSLTEGVDRPSRALVRLWKAAYALSPTVCGGCRPLLLADLVRQTGLAVREREVVVQLGVPSEVLAADKI
jgi:ubiquinone/menaquinone biosynthesis C-methylase UbiE